MYNIYNIQNLEIFFTPSPLMWAYMSLSIAIQQHNYLFTALLALYKDACLTFHALHINFDVNI